MTLLILTPPNTKANLSLYKKSLVKTASKTLNTQHKSERSTSTQMRCSVSQKRIKRLKQQLKDRHEQIDQLEKHVLALETETGLQHSKKKRRLENNGGK